MADNLKFNPNAMATARAKSGASLREVAAAIGVAKSAVSRWENGVRDPRGYHLEKLAIALGVSVGKLCVRQLAFQPRLLKRLRKRARLSMRKLADQVGVTVNAVSRWESGLDQPGDTNAQVLAGVLKIEVTDLYR